MILNSAAAGPVGRRRSCSQFCKVFTLTPIKLAPIKLANSDCDRLVRSRIARIPEGRRDRSEETLGTIFQREREGFTNELTLAYASGETTILG
jgi:hypothetical protein